jgi:molybdopterin-guanine dinucleotide biosynthesis protein A
MNVDGAVVLAGGRSTRMGRDKALERVGGIMMLERVVRGAAAVCGEVVVVGRERAPEGWPAGLAARFVPDAEKSSIGERSGGPLVGVIRGLDILQRAALVVACDVPLVRPETLRGLIGAHAAELLATMACVDGEAEPTVAVYAPGVLPELRRMLAENRRSLQQVTRLAGVQLWTVPAGCAGEFLNVNDDASLAEARRRLAVA